MEFKIPKSEQQGVMETFWTMMRECESKADCDNDPLLKHWVEQWFKQWSRVTGRECYPIWVSRQLLKDKGQL